MIGCEPPRLIARRLDILMFFSENMHKGIDSGSKQEYNYETEFEN